MQNRELNTCKQDIYSFLRFSLPTNTEPVTDRYEDLFYGRKAQEISRLWATEYIAGCADCAFQSICGADPVRNYSTQGDMYGFRPTSTFCRKHKAIIEHIFGLLADRREEVLPIFKSWITGTRG
ncbi:hypothetical protein [Alistipes finegoldii]|jgi:hypothetical protein|uniref:hypothetical protein n=1 Tax=Alistipes finegoldii TaxID=214856 RepID=UPI002665C01A|nr:hypothetical protein [Alistipes finegoldii]